MIEVDASSNGRAQERWGSRPLRAGRPEVVVVGAGAAGTLVALHLTRTAALRSTGLDVQSVTRAPIFWKASRHERAPGGPRAFRVVAPA